jgi:hypothetical protein
MLIPSNHHRPVRLAEIAPRSTGWAEQPPLNIALSRSKKACLLPTSNIEVVEADQLTGKRKVMSKF